SNLAPVRRRSAMGMSPRSAIWHYVLRRMTTAFSSAERSSSSSSSASSSDGARSTWCSVSLDRASQRRPPRYYCATEQHIGVAIRLLVMMPEHAAAPSAHLLILHSAVLQGGPSGGLTCMHHVSSTSQPHAHSVSDHGTFPHGLRCER